MSETFRHWLDDDGRALWARVEALIARGVAWPADAEERARWSAERDRLALELFAWQRQRAPAIDRVAWAFAGEGAIARVAEMPGVPTDVFKSTRVACFAPEHTTRVFKTSGTTQEVKGTHEFADTSLYTAAALAMGRACLFPRERYRFVLLAESEADAPHSSLSFMLARFAERWSAVPGDDPWMVRGGALAVERVPGAVEAARREGTPVALLGASFAFVHLLDALGKGERWALPEGSVVMPTGGFKGRSREVPADELFGAISTRFGVARTQIVQEYGMTELSSQAYERHDGAAPGRYVAPPWMVVTAVDPVTLEPVGEGETGLLRVIDLANVGSCIAIQTSDLGAVAADGSFVVQGRAPGATPRGCARAIDAVLSGAP
jgi:hypothetical protein